MRRRLGLLKRRFPIGTWSQIALAERLCAGVPHQPEDFLKAHQSNGRRFFFENGCPPVFNNIYAKQELLVHADEILQNRFRYFFDKSYDLGPGPDWFVNPATGRRADAGKHWCDIDHFDQSTGDIKFIWEPSRFGWAYTLVRAYSVTRLEKYADKFWSLFESWLENNQPNRGPNYACGQECAIRLMAMCFALYGLGKAQASTVDRKVRIITAIVVHAERIEKNIDFAVWTRTNHSLTEAAGLYTTGLLFPELKRSEYWTKLGKNILTREGLKQIYPDGSYIQHSMNYHRLMLQDFLWVMRLAELNGDKFPDELVGRVGKAVDFLYQVQDEVTGRVPNYGANDGALILPLNSCDYLDYRPVIQNCWYLLKREKLYENGPWDEDAVWLFGDEITKLPAIHKERTSTRFACGGYYTIRLGNSWSMSRCHSYRDRVGHIDLLHLDLWADGINLLRDSGSYKYFAPDEPQLELYFMSIWSHNTVIVDDDCPLGPVSRFLYLPRPGAKLLSFEVGEDHTEWKGEHLGYARFPWRVIHSREVLARQGRWEIIDRLTGQGRHKAELRWHLPDEVKLVHRDRCLVRLMLPGHWHLEVSDSGEIESELLRGQVNGGYESVYYGRKDPIQTLSVKKQEHLPMTFKTVVWKE
jgi:hypothetical protein